LKIVISSEITSLKGHYKKSSTGWQTCVKVGEYILPKLNILKIPIANKYFEGKLKNTLVREWNRVWKLADCKAETRLKF